MAAFIAIWLSANPGSLSAWAGEPELPTILEGFGSTERSLTEVTDFAVSLPTTPQAPIVVSSGGDTFGIGLPSSGFTGLSESTPTLRSFEYANGAEFVVTSSHEGVQIVSQILSPSEPEEFRFDLTGDFSTAQVMPNGAVFLWTDTHGLAGGFFPPWAQDASGRAVDTSYTLEENTLVQTVRHKQHSQITYPVTFDPAFATGVLSKSDDVPYGAGGYQVRAWLSAWGRLVYHIDSRILTSEAWSVLKKYHWQMSVPQWQSSLQQQWECHVTGGWLEWDSWDLETIRPANSAWLSRIWNNLLTPSAVCNW